ncbi:MAG: IS110 family transposase [Bacilli bacterium]|nr:IS110 family transposase [Bacilli bacterium]
MPYHVGIDVSKWKHDVFAIDQDGAVALKPFQIRNDAEGFSNLLKSLEALGDKAGVRICMESTGHYHKAVYGFLRDRGYSPSVVNPYLVSAFARGTTLRKEKNDRADAIALARYSLEKGPAPGESQSDALEQLKSLTRARDRLVRERSDKIVVITNCLDRIFPEFTDFLEVKSAVARLILSKKADAESIASMTPAFMERARKLSRRASALRIQSLKEAASKTVGRPDPAASAIISATIPVLESVDKAIERIEGEIKAIMSGMEEHVSSIPGISAISAAAILGEYGDISRFGNPGKMLAFAGLESSHSQSGQSDSHGKMVKRGSPHLRYVLMNVAVTAKNWNQVLAEYYNKKRVTEGKKRRVALNHVAKKLIRIIWKLQTEGIDFDASKLR